MSDPNTPTPEDPETAGAETPPQPGGAPETAEPGPDQLKAIIAALQSDLGQKHEQLLRLAADMDNLRKRTEREKEETAKFAITKFARDLVGVTDNFERATAAVPAGAADADPALASLIEGIGMTARELHSVLERHGVKRIWPEGEMFNPHYHQPMMQQDMPDLPAGTILQVFQAGYLIDERVVRPAVVVVSRGGPKAAKPEGNGTPREPAPPAAAPEDPSNSE
jgi:molecular chaperone GrpE